MIELKVHCDCGQKYKFDVEPVNNQMPFSVACPICKRDGTAKANTLLQQMSVFKMVEPAPAPVAAAAVAPAPARVSVAPPPIAAAPAAPAPIAPPPPVPAGAARLRINTATHAESPAASASADAPPAIAPLAGTAPPPIGARPRIGMAAASGAGEPVKKGNFAMGLLGAFLGALIGSVLYFVIYKTTGVRLFLAIGVGGLTGWLANLLGRGEGSKELGGLAAVFTIVGVLAAYYLGASDRWNQRYERTDEIAQAIEDGGYSNSVVEAKEVVKVVPTGSDSEIRMYLARQDAGEGEMPKPASISNEQVKEFHDTELPEYQDLASGKLTREQYWAKNGFDPKAAKKAADTAESTVRGIFFVATLLKIGIFSIIAGAGLAYKLSANA